MEKLKITCIGFNIESQIALEGLIDAGVDIECLVTLPPGQSHGVSDYVDLHSICKKNGIPVVDTKDVNSQSTLAEIRDYSPDYIFTLAWNRLFSDELLRIPKKFVIGSHPSLLPEGRGRAPVPWTILQGHTKSGVSFFVMDSQADEGQLLLQREFSIDKNAYAYDVYLQVAENLRDGFIELYRKTCIEDLVPIPFPDRKPTYRAKRTPNDGRIDFSQDAESICRLIRAVSYPYPGAFTFYGSTKVIIWKCAPYSGETEYTALPGQVLQKSEDALLVQTGTVPVWLTDLSFDKEFNLAKIQIEQKMAFDCEVEIFKLKQELNKLKSKTND